MIIALSKKNIKKLFRNITIYLFNLYYQIKEKEYIVHILRYLAIVKANMLKVC